MRVSIGDLSIAPPGPAAARGAVTLPDAIPGARPGPAGPLRLAVRGLQSHEHDVLVAILRVLEERTEGRWTLCDRAAPDLLLHTREVDAAVESGALQALLVREGEAAPAPDTLATGMPLRVMAVLDLLNAAHDRLRQRRMCERDAAPGRLDGLGIEDDGKALASALSRLLERRVEQIFRVRILGHGTLYLCQSARMYCIDFPRERLSSALEQHRFVLTTISPAAPELAGLMEQARPIDEVLWSIGLVTPWESPDARQARFRLRQWPDLARLPHRPAHIQACAALAARAMTLQALVAATSMSSNDAQHLLHACSLCGLLDALAPEVAPQAPAERAPTQDAGAASLFGRLWKRFGLG